MKTAYLSDIHANVEALQVVLDDARKRGADRYACLGDIVGYGPDPNECVKIIQDTCEAVVVGNHDYAALGELDTSSFNEYAQEAADWTASELDEDSRSFLASLPLVTVLDDRMLVHASPRDPERWTYVLSFEEAGRQFRAFREKLCFIGHSHLPIVIGHDGNKVLALPFTVGEPLVLRPEFRYMVNVGSVGQPRDRDPRAGYVIHDEEAATVTSIRLEYPIAAVQRKIARAGLPSFLARRLETGV